MRRYPRGPHFADARRRLTILREDFDPPRQFELYPFEDVLPPPPEEYTIIDRPVLVFDDPEYEPVPPPPVYFVQDREDDFYDRPPPPFAIAEGYLPIPLPIFPVAFPYDRNVFEPGRIILPDYGRNGGDITVVDTFDGSGNPVVTQTNSNNQVVSVVNTTTINNNTRIITQTGPDNQVVSKTTQTANPNGERVVTQVGPDNQIVATEKSR